VEVIEKYEQQQAVKALNIFNQIKEAELMETQRMWAAANRKSEEIERRNLELRTQKANSVFA